MPTQRFFKGTCSGVTGPVYVSFEMLAEIVKYEDPTDDKVKNLAVRGKAATVEVRTEVDPTSLVGTIAEGVILTMDDPAGGTDFSKTFAKVGWKSVKAETGQEDTKPGQFTLSGEAEWPT